MLNIMPYKLNMEAVYENSRIELERRIYASMKRIDEAPKKPLCLVRKLSPVFEVYFIERRV